MIESRCIGCGKVLETGDDVEHGLCNVCKINLNQLSYTKYICLSELKGFLLVEDGSVDIDKLEEKIQGSGIQIVVYRAGAPMPKLIMLKKEEEL